MNKAVVLIEDKYLKGDLGSFAPEDHNIYPDAILEQLLGKDQTYLHSHTMYFSPKPSHRFYLSLKETVFH